MRGYVLGFEAIDRTEVALVGGKGASLGELSRMRDVSVPAGFCVTTEAFRRVMALAPSIDARRDLLARLTPDDRDAISLLSADLRRTIEAVAVPADIALEISHALARLGEHAAYAVRSSATAEDSATASFAGQGDTFLNVVGTAAVLGNISRCWASLFSERAVSYRLQRGLAHDAIDMAVVVQRMVVPDAAGVLFTADPVTGHRKVMCVEATRGLGDALVSGRVNADRYKVRGDALIDRPAPASEAVLTDAQVVRLAALGRRIEAHFGAPQDIEWCLRDEDFWIVQSRPITTLFPVPVAPDSDEHVYLSVGHQQMMTDAMKPLGWSLFQLTAARPMFEAGGRLFVDVTQALKSSAMRAALVEGFTKSDPLTGDALRSIAERSEPVPSAPAARPPAAAAPIATDAALVAELVANDEASLRTLKRDIHTKSGSALFDFILADVEALKRGLFEPRNIGVILAAMEATAWLDANMQAWLGEKNAADTLAQSAPNNVTSEMGLALMDVADVIRPHADVVACLQHVEGDAFMDALTQVSGGAEARAAIAAFLARYGMRCVGEIDITRPRWSERPSTLVPMLLGNIRSFAPGESKRRFEHGQAVARAKEEELLQRLRALPDGADNAQETKRMIDRLRTFIGYREYPKYGLVSRYFVYKQALMREADRLVQAGVIEAREDIFYLTLGELHDAVRTREVRPEVIRERSDAFRAYRALTPPRVITSDGEVIHGAYRRHDVPGGALVGLAVSAGIIEGRARVVRDVADADLDAGDILVTTFTDPSWTPLFVAIKGLVTEVGGVMTHGSVIAREYGLPAVVGVERATQLIRDGQRIRVNGSDGYVEILSD